MKRLGLTRLVESRTGTRETGRATVTPTTQEGGPEEPPHTQSDTQKHHVIILAFPTLQAPAAPPAAMKRLAVSEVDDETDSEEDVPIVKKTSAPKPAPAVSFAAPAVSPAPTPAVSPAPTPAVSFAPLPAVPPAAAPAVSPAPKASPMTKLMIAEVEAESDEEVEPAPAKGAAARAVKEAAETGAAARAAGAINPASAAKEAAERAVKEVSETGVAARAAAATEAAALAAAEALCGSATVLFDSSSYEPAAAKWTAALEASPSSVSYIDRSIYVHICTFM